MKTEVVYVCSPDFRKYLVLSLRTLLNSNPDIGAIRVYVVSDADVGWDLGDSRIRVERVPDIGTTGPWGYYWGNNKIHLCQSEADRVIYLDTDTMILRPLQQVYEGIDSDLIARPGVEIYMGIHDENKWEKSLATVGAQSFPYFSPGFMVFQNGSHRRIADSWHEIIELILRDRLAIWARKHAEMYAFSLAAAVHGLTHHAMEDHHHRYAMIGESHEDAVVHHLGTPGFYRHYLPIEKELGLDRDDSIAVDRPLLTPVHAVSQRIRNAIDVRLRRRPREESVKY